MFNLLNKVIIKSTNILTAVKTFVVTQMVRCRNYFCGISSGKGCIYYGTPKFLRIPGSSISIGNKCSFRSAKNSNLIGINRACIVATHLPKAVLNIGNNCGFSGTVIGCFKEINIGNNVRCGANTLITDSDWHLDDHRSGVPKAITIEDNVWLGYGVIVMKGVNIGANSVIGAGSIVTTNIPANVIAAGNPCRVIKQVINE
jgi:acetyltransferase-like isoleucine patch superfamily enzyme